MAQIEAVDDYPYLSAHHHPGVDQGADPDFGHGA